MTLKELKLSGIDETTTGAAAKRRHPRAYMASCESTHHRRADVAASRLKAESSSHSNPV